MRKFGRFLLSFVPMIVFLVVQIVVTIIAMVALMVTSIVNGSGDDPFASLEMTLTTGLFEHTALIMLVTELFAILIFGLWYYFYLKKPKLENPIEVFSMKSIISIIALCFGLTMLIDWLFQIVHYANPTILEEYNELMEMSGIADFSLYSILTVVVLAPICEELVFRGLTLKLAQKFTSRFWLANTIQAFAFGFIHLNLLQGTYAFALGLVLGYLYKKYQSLYVPIFMHMVFNFIGSVVTEMVYTKIDSEIVWWILSIITFAAGVWGMIVLSKDKSRVVADQSNNSVFH